jgi:sporulation protein YlmC with PRC-barrel domain
MTKITTALALFILLSGFSAPTFASQGNAPWEAVESTPPSTSTNDAEEIFSESQPGVLTTPEGEILGAVVDFIFDLRANRILYTVGVLHSSEEFEDRVFVFPWKVAQVDIDTNSFTLKEGKTLLPKAPSFPLDAWLTLPPAQWTAAINAAWKEKESANFAKAPASDPVLSRASDLIGKTVKTAKGEDVGALAELLVDPEKGSIAYAIISFDDSGNNSHILFYSLPWTAVQADPVQLTFVVPDFVKEKLHDPPPFQADCRPACKVEALHAANGMTS